MGLLITNNPNYEGDSFKVKYVDHDDSSLGEETIVYPGHGLSTRIKDEKPIYLELKPKKY